MSTVLIIGAGPNVGKACAENFSAAGFKVAVASRTQKLDPKYRHYTFDASKPETVPALFEHVSADIGVPSVVIYNTYAAGTTDADKPFDSDLDLFQKNLNINTISGYVAAREAVKGFDKLGSSGLGPAGGTFIFTGNLLNVGVFPGHVAFGMAKSAAAHMIQHLALVAFHDKPYKFYYADERHENGVYMTTDLNGDAHGEVYLELAKDPKQRAWDYVFVKGKGYVEFPRWEVWPRPGID
ncbi:NAD(P)-binding protein [Hypoxylon rubiginosum]|uniref:NAD(P)-binding protein n=1 Tax=Hypoxylon rubiginosum TaxID=110542 RepID=A0ACB9YIP0_9PEZI|nr:NAD(P)-binding protein [Hypoxylon rubiginosum]